jgi:hypothetical protein
MKETKVFSSRDSKTGESLEFAIEIDWDWLARQAARKLRLNRTGKTRMMNGAITAKIAPKNSGD